MLRDVGKPGEQRPPLTPDEGTRTAEQWEHALDARQRDAERRDMDADERDRLADERETKADLRDVVADERETKADLRDADADERDAKADLRDADADERDARADLRDRELLTDSATARLQAQLETMPVIEQAKGILMEREGCTAEQAFDLLRKASQSSNVPIRELALRIVDTRRTPGDIDPGG
jgi:ANTAR domain